MMKYIFYLSLLLTLTTVEVKADFFDDTIDSIGGFFTDLGGKIQNLSEDDFTDFKHKVENLVKNIKDSDLDTKVENAFNNALEKVNNVVKDVDLKDVKIKVDELIQDAKDIQIFKDLKTSIGNFFNDIGDNIRSIDSLDDLKNKIEEEISSLANRFKKFDVDDLKTNLENLFDEAKEEMKNNSGDFDSNDLKTLKIRAEALIQKAEDNGMERIDWNSSASLKFSSVTLLLLIPLLHDLFL